MIKGSLHQEDNNYKNECTKNSFEIHKVKSDRTKEKQIHNYSWKSQQSFITNWNNTENFKTL